MKKNKAFSLIISDLHLTLGRPEAMHLFTKFIQQRAPQAEALYILGDFFEFWIGDDDLTPFHQRVIALLATLKASNTALYIMHGNRDFLLGKKFFKACHAQFLPDPSVIDFYGTNTLLIHGDSLCTDDVRYQRYRRVVNLKGIQYFFRCLPLRWRRWVATKLRNSNPHVDRPDRPINLGHPADVKPEAAEQAMHKHKVSRIIHGHTHRYAKHWHAHGVRYVMSDWHSHGSYLTVSASGVTMHDVNHTLS